MLDKLVKDIMIPIHDYPTLGSDATLYDALSKLDTAKIKHQGNEEPFKAVLIKDARGKIIGKAGLLTLINAMNSCFIDTKAENQFNVNKDDFAAVKAHLDFWKNDLRDLGFDAKTIKMTEIMQPVKNCIDINAPVSEAIQKLSIYRSISILVKDGVSIVGIIRLSDIFNEFKDFVLNKNN